MNVTVFEISYVGLVQAAVLSEVGLNGVVKATFFASLIKAPLELNNKLG